MADVDKSSKTELPPRRNYLKLDPEVTSLRLLKLG